MPITSELVGQRFGRLTVLQQAPSWNGRRCYICLCDCGCVRIHPISRLRSGDMRSCGCLNREVLATRKLVHGDTWQGGSTPEYRAWLNMKGRCYNPKNASYRRYGGRGLTVIERWRNSFEAFLEDMGRRPSPQHSLDRIDNSLGYFPENCRWATAVVQKRNSGGIFRVNIGGKIVCLKEACDLHGVSYGLIRNRVRRGWPSEKALATPKMAGWQRKKPRRIDRRPDP